jgi:hypothetical protein
VIDFDTACAVFDCNRCNGSGVDPIRVGIGDEHPCDAVYCDDCGGSRERVVYLGTFFDNLAVAGAIQLGIDIGRAIGVDDCEVGEGYTSNSPWTPNTTANPAPGWRGK